MSKSAVLMRCLCKASGINEGVENKIPGKEYCFPCGSKDIDTVTIGCSSSFGRASMAFLVLRHFGQGWYCRPRPLLLKKYDSCPEKLTS